MIFSYQYQTKWHDTDFKREVTSSHLLAYMQETSNYHLIGAGMSLDELRDTKGLAFLLSRVSMRMYEPLYANETITVQTWVCESRGLSFHRCFRILRDETVIAEAFTIWALLDLNAKKLLPVTEFPYDIEPEAPLGAEFSARVRFPAVSAMEAVGKRSIVYSDIDYNGHMNNTHYPNMLCDFTPEICRRRVTGVTLSFLHEATFGHELQVYRAQNGNDFLFRMMDGEISCIEALVKTEEL